MATIPRYTGPFRTAQAERLLWRAGFGPRRGEAASLAKLGLDGAVRSLTHPPGERWTGPAPHDDKGRPLAPADAYGHDHLWWLDRMVRTRRPLVERMTLVWHDWFATSNAGVGSQKLMLAQNRLLRRNALGRFDRLLIEITANPAMLLWLSGTDNRKGAPNENYGRELMELFTLGEGNGYTERDVREQARALTGWTSTWTRSKGQTNFRFDANRHDAGMKTVFGKQGDFTWRDSVSLCIHHPKHAAFFVDKLWGYFVPAPPDAKTRAGLDRYLPARLRGAPRARCDPPASGALHRPPHGEVADRLHRRACCAGSAAGSTRRPGSGSPKARASGSSTHRTWPAGTTRAGSTRTRSTAAGGSRTPRSRRSRSVTERARRGPRCRTTPRRSSRARWPCSGTPRSAPRRGASCSPSPAARLKSATGWKADAYPPLVANAVRQLLAVSPDLQTC